MLRLKRRERERKKIKEGADFLLERDDKVERYGLVFIERERRTECSDKKKKVALFLFIYFKERESVCVAGILASLCLSIYFFLFHLLKKKVKLLFVPLGVGRQCLVI